MTLEDPRKIPDIKMKRTATQRKWLVSTTRVEVPMHPTLEHAKKVRTKKEGSDVRVYDARLNYGRKTIAGFVYKQLKDYRRYDTPENIKHNKELLEDSLSQWTRIRAIKSELRKNGQEGFNLPPTIRGICTSENREAGRENDAAAGFLITDFAKDGKHEVFDVKWANEHADKISPKDWNDIKTQIIRDMDIALEHKIKIFGGNSALDAWLVVKNKDTNECKVYLSDISQYTSTKLDPLLREGNIRNDLTFLRTKALDWLTQIEKSLKDRWNQPKQPA